MDVDERKKKFLIPIKPYKARTYLHLTLSYIFQEPIDKISEELNMFLTFVNVSFLPECGRTLTLGSSSCGHCMSPIVQNI